MIKPPCKDCNKRELGCHSNCPEYQDYKKKTAEAREVEMKEKLRPAYKKPVSAKAFKRNKRSK